MGFWRGVNRHKSSWGEKGEEGDGDDDDDDDDYYFIFKGFFTSPIKGLFAATLQRALRKQDESKRGGGGGRPRDDKAPHDPHMSVAMGSSAPRQAGYSKYINGAQKTKSKRLG